MDEKTVKKLIQQGITDYMMNSQYSVTQIPSHVHNGVDSQQVSYNSLTDVADTVTYTLFGTNAATSSNYSIFFVAPYQLKLMSAREVHATNGTDGGAVSLQIERLTGTTAPGSGDPRPDRHHTRRQSALAGGDRACARERSGPEDFADSGRGGRLPDPRRAGRIRSGVGSEGVPYAGHHADREFDRRHAQREVEFHGGERHAAVDGLKSLRRDLRAFL